MRRAVIDTYLHNLINQYDGLSSSVNKNVAKNCSHVRIKTNDIILTANAVKYHSQPVKYAAFRETYAEDNRQLELFSTDTPKNENGLFYAMLLHGSDENDLARVSFAYLGYPSADLKGYVTLINLEKYCSNELYLTTPQEEIKEASSPKLKKLSTAIVEE